MYDNTELRIVKEVYLNPGIHKRQLSKKLKLGMPSIDYALKKIESILKIKKSGNQLQHFIDYSKEKIVPVLYSVENKRTEEFPVKVRTALHDLLKELKIKPLLAIIFGSYAKDNYQKTSDIDILLVYQKLEDVKNIENTAKRISMRTNTELNPAYLDYNEFKESFHNPTKKFFKNLKKNKIILTGMEWWRQLEDEEA